MIENVSYLFYIGYCISSVWYIHILTTPIRILYMQFFAIRPNIGNSLSRLILRKYQYRKPLNIRGFS